MRLSHGLANTRAVFDDPNLLAHAGLAPVAALAGRAGLPDLLAGVRPGGACGSGAVTKVTCLVAGMAAGADSIDGMDLLRDGAIETLFERGPRPLHARLPPADYGRLTTMPSCEDDAHRSADSGRPLSSNAFERSSFGGRPDNGPLSLHQAGFRCRRARWCE